MSKSWHEMTMAERVVDRIAKNRAIEQQSALTTNVRKPGPKAARKPAARNDGVNFSQEEVFPPIACALRSLCETSAGYVGHRQIREALLLDSGLAPFLVSAVANDAEGRSKEWWAESMMKWFSQAFTAGRNEFAGLFEREPNVRPWRYRLRPR